MASKRQRVSQPAAPCGVADLQGSLTDTVDAIDLMAKSMALAMSSHEVDCSVTTLKKMSAHGVVSFGSMCSGSGLGDLALHKLSESLQRFRPDMPKLECAFLCELDKRKADWLASLKISDRIFCDCTKMGSSKCFDWVSGRLQDVPGAGIVFFGFSCKGLSGMNKNSSAATKYVQEVLEAFTGDPSAPAFDPMYLQDHPLKGSTAPTLIGAMQYVQQHRPAYVLMENVIGVVHLMENIQRLLESWNYVFFCTSKLDPTMFGLPNSRPRLYFGGRQRSAMSGDPAPYADKVNGFLKDVTARFQDQSPMPLEMFLLDASSSYHLNLLSGVHRQPQRAAGDDQWPEKHEEAFSSAGLQRPSRASLERYAAGAPLAGMASWFLAQPLRKQEVAFLAAVACPPTGPEMTVDIGQDIRRLHYAKGRLGSEAAVVHCFCEHSQPWLVRSRRYLTGRERLAMHGISLREVTKIESDSFLADLAGNSFSGTVFMSAFVAGCQG